MIKRTNGTEPLEKKDRRFLSLFVSITLIISGFLGITFISIAPINAAGSDFSIPAGVHWYMEDLVNYSSGVVTNQADVFFFHGNITIDTGASLHINSSYELRFDDNKKLVVRGKLVSDGTDGQLVTIRSNTTHSPGAFKGLYFNSNGTKSYLNHTRIYHANYALELLNSTVYLDSVFINSSFGSAISLKNSTCIYYNGLMNDTGLEAIAGLENTTLLMDNITIRNCLEALNTSVIEPHIMNITINNTNISNMTTKGIRLVGTGGGNITLSNVTISDSFVGVKINQPIIAELSVVSLLNTSSAISLDQISEGSVIEDLVMDNCSNGIFFGGANIQVSDVEINSSRMAIGVSDSTDLILDQIDITNTTEGIFLSNVNGSTFSHINMSDLLGGGFNITGSTNLRITDMQIMGAYSGIIVTGSNNTTISDFTVDDGQTDGIRCMNTSFISLSNISISNCNGNGIRAHQSGNNTWENISISACGIGLNASGTDAIVIDGAQGAWCSGASDIYYHLRDIDQAIFLNLTATNNDGKAILLENISNCTISNVTVSTPGRVPIVINNSLTNESLTHIHGSNISNFKGGLRVLGNESRSTEVRIVNTTFSGYGNEYLNLTRALVFLLNSTLALDHITMNTSYLWAEYYMCVRAYNLTGENLSCHVVEIRDENLTSYYREYPGCIGDAVTWRNITYIEMNATNVTNITYNYPLNVTVRKWGYYADNITILVPGNNPLEFFMNDTEAPFTWWTPMGPNYNGTDRVFIANDSFINLTVLDDDGCGVNHTYYNLSWGENHTGWTEFTSPVSPFYRNGSGDYTLYFYSTDYENNAEDVSFKNITVDYEAPEFHELELDVFYRLNGTDMYNVSAATVFTMDFSDVCGIHHYWYTIDDNYYTTDYSMPFFTFFEYPDGICDITVGAVDNLSFNGTGDTITVRLDTQKPLVIETINGSYDDGTYFFVGKNTNISLNASDIGSGLKRIYYELDDIEYDYTGNITMANLSEGNHYLKIGGEDNLGNSGWSSVARPSSRIVLDLTPPTVTPVFNGAHHTLTGTEDVYIRTSTVVELSAEDVSGNLPQSGQKGIWYSLDGGKIIWDDRIPLLSEGEHRLSFGAVDNMGNNHTQDEIVIFVNESAPTAPELRLPSNRTKFEQLWVDGSVPLDCTVKVVVNYERTYTETPDEEGNFTLAVLLDPGENFLTAYTVDYFNRQSLSTTPILVLLDNEVPYLTGLEPKQNSKEVPIDTEIRADFNEPLSKVNIILWDFDEDGREWKQVGGETQYEPWNLFCNFIPSETLLKETKYKMEVDMTDTCRRYEEDTAGNTDRAYLYSKGSGESYTFITESKEHEKEETNYVIKSQVINITYGKMGYAPLSRQDLLQPIADEPAPPPEDNVSLGIYFSVTFEESVKYAKITLRYYLNAHQLYYKLRNPELWDIDNISFYTLNNDSWKMTTTGKMFPESTIWVYFNNPGTAAITLGIFAPDLDWDDDGYPYPVDKVDNNAHLDQFPRDPNEQMDRDGDGVGDNADPFPDDPAYKSDDDGDGIPNNWERIFGLSPFDDRDGENDLDGDGLTNLNEYLSGTLPNHWDSDGDGMSDGWEWDSNGNGIPDREEFEHFLDPAESYEYLFSLRSEYQFILTPDHLQYLTIGGINNSLRNAFSNNSIFLSAGARVSFINDEWWEISNGSEIYGVQNSSTGLNVYELDHYGLLKNGTVPGSLVDAFENEYRFNLSSDHAGLLANTTIQAGLLSSFAENGVELSSSAKVVPLDVGEWQIVDDEITFNVELIGSEIKIFEHHNISLSRKARVSLLEMDLWEIRDGSDIYRVHNLYSELKIYRSEKDHDSDNDGFTNYEEYQKGTDPWKDEVVTEKADEEEPNYALMAIVILGLAGLLLLLGYLFIYRKKKEKREKEESEYYDLQDLASVEFPSDMDWGGRGEPMEVFELDYLDSSPEIMDFDFDRIGGDLHTSIFDDIEFRELMGRFNVFTVPRIECSNCGESVEDGDETCPSCHREFEEEMDLEAGLDEAELDELFTNLDTTTCSNCGSATSPGEKDCEECGSIFLEDDEMMCSKCDGIVKEDASKCEHCGAAFE